MNALSGKAAIAGIGATEFSKNSGRSELRLAVEATLAALADAGIDPEEVDGLSTYTMDNNPEIELFRNIGGRNLKFFSRIHYGGGAACAPIMHAAMAAADTLRVRITRSPPCGRKIPVCCVLRHLSGSVHPLSGRRMHVQSSAPSLSYGGSRGQQKLSRAEDRIRRWREDRCGSAITVVRTRCAPRAWPLRRRTGASSIARCTREVNDERDRHVIA